jgi:hypothetical protein
MNMMKQAYYSVTGKPFTDQDAAQFKAETMSLELGEEFVVSATEGGYVVIPADTQQQEVEAHVPLYPELANTSEPAISDDSMESTPTPESYAESDEDSEHEPEDPAEEIKLPVYTPVSEPEPEKDLYVEYQQSPYLESSQGGDSPMETSGEAEMDVDVTDQDSTTNEFSEKFAGKLQDAAAEADARHQAKEKEERETLKEIKIRPAWISQWHWGVMVVAGFTIAIFPTLFPILLLGVGETQAMIAEYPWALDMMNYIGLGMAGYAAYMAINVALAYEYRITPTTVHAKEGIVSRKKIRIDLANVVNLELTQSAQERMIGVGNIEFSSAGTGDVDLTFRQIDTPEKIHDIIKNRIDLVRQHMKQMHR